MNTSFCLLLSVGLFYRWPRVKQVKPDPPKNSFFAFSTDSHIARRQRCFSPGQAHYGQDQSVKKCSLFTCLIWLKNETAGLGRTVYKSKQQEGNTECPLCGTPYIVMLWTLNLILGISNHGGKNGKNYLEAAFPKTVSNAFPCWRIL